MIITFSMSVYKVGLKTNPNEQDHRVPVLSWSTCAYTIQSIGENSPERASQVYLRTCAWMSQVLVTWRLR